MNRRNLEEAVAFLRLVGHLVRRAREAAALTPAELASRAGLTPEAVAGLERGECGVDVDQLHRIAEALGLPTADLVPDMESVRRQASSST